MKIREMQIEDFPEVLALWKRTEGIGLNESDTEEQLAQFLERNPGFSFVATNESGAIIGAVLCGHEGRRGYLHHLAVDSQHRRQLLGSSLVDRCLEKLKSAKILKCNLFLFRENHEGRAFWEKSGWAVREDLVVVQKVLS